MDGLKPFDPKRICRHLKLHKVRVDTKVADPSRIRYVMVGMDGKPTRHTYTSLYRKRKLGFAKGRPINSRN